MFLADAIDSVLSQSFSNWELLLVNDGSTDASEEIARWYMERKPEKIKYLQHPGGNNLGLSSSRNLALNHARGKYIAYIDADDAWLPTKLEEQVSLLEKHPHIGMTFGPTKLWYSWQNDDKSEEADRITPLGVSPGQYDPPALMKQLYPLGDGGSPAPTSMLVRHSAIERHGHFEDGYPGIFEDQPFYAKMYFNVPIWVTDKCLDFHREHPESMCSVARSKGSYHREREQFLTWLHAYLSHQKAVDSSVWYMLWRAQLTYRFPQVRHLRYMMRHNYNRASTWLKRQTKLADEQVPV